jgi:hypothetical protein
MEGTIEGRTVKKECFFFCQLETYHRASVKATLIAGHTLDHGTELTPINVPNLAQCALDR